MVSRVQRERAATDLAKKLRLEPKLARELGPLMREISATALTLYAASGRILDTSIFQNEIEAILSRHYRRVAKEFAGTNTDIVRQDIDLSLTEELEDEIQAATNNFVKNEPIARADLINETNQKDLNDSFEKVLLAAAIAGAALSRREVAKQATDDFKRKAVNRAQNVIPITETQNAAEGIKHEEGSTVSGEAVVAGAIAGVALTARKTWVTVGDAKVRELHVEADGQEQMVNQPFNVGGELLMYPGDITLGASAGNTVNCRCSSQLNLKS